MQTFWRHVVRRVLVIDSGRTRTEAARKVTEALTRSQVKILGVVLNRISSRAAVTITTTITIIRMAARKPSPMATAITKMANRRTDTAKQKRQRNKKIPNHPACWLASEQIIVGRFSKIRRKILSTIRFHVWQLE